MWNFLPSGLLMPAAVPMDKANPEFTHDGAYDLQVRGRVTQHLRYFMDTYMEPGTFHDVIEETPGMDYNCRFYTTREAYADAMRLAILDIDYKKFKPEAERKNDAGVLLYGSKEETYTYHSVLNSIWGSVTRLGRPGGSWGLKSDENPNGYSPNWRYGRGIGSSFLRDRDEDLTPMFSDDTYAERGEDLDWTPRSETYAEQLLGEVEGLPEEEWGDFLTNYEIEVIHEHQQRTARAKSDTTSYRKAERQSRREEKRTARRYRRANRKTNR